MTGLLVLDFDGTMTDAEAEGEPYRSGYLQDLALLTDQPLEQIEALAEEIGQRVAADPQRYGWHFGGHIVAPATVDPYLRVMPVARQILDHFGVFKNPDDRRRLLDNVLYKYNYGKTRDVFKPGAHEALRALAGSPTYVVTNSHTEAVKAKIQGLGDLGWLVERVFGGAKKYALDPEFEQVDSELRLAGLERPVLLRRRRYFDILNRLRQEQGADWDQVVVAGDIFELDLALPLALGARIALVANQFTPAYELEFVERHERAQVLRDIRELPELLD